MHVLATFLFLFQKDDDQCRNGIWNKQTQPEEQTEDKHIAVCADFCTHDNFTYFGITSNICYCYDEITFNNLTNVGDCQPTLCPGNSFDTCGVTPNPVIYEKQTTFTSLECVTAFIYGYGIGQSFIKGNCTAELSYICRVGDSNDIKCTFDELTVTTEQHQQHTSFIISTAEIPTTVAKDTQEGSKIFDRSSTMDYTSVAASNKFSNLETIHSTVKATHTSSVTENSDTNIYHATQSANLGLTENKIFSTVKGTSEKLFVASTKNEYTERTTTEKITNVESETFSKDTSHVSNPLSIDTFTVSKSSADDISTKVTMSFLNSLSITESQYVTSSQSTTKTEGNTNQSQITTVAISSQDTVRLPDIANSTYPASFITEVSTSSKSNELQVNTEVVLAESPIIKLVINKKKLRSQRFLMKRSDSFLYCNHQDLDTITKYMYCNPPPFFVVMISGSIIGVGILMLSILIFVLLFKACYRKHAKGKKVIKQENFLSQLENSPYHIDSQIFTNMYNFSDGVNPFGQNKHTYYSSDYFVY
ncbi:unnamed protein product [Mytilus coruscus]|uniref:WSC domain-containing protein n=1 Tax=Mytilus coruscus TaxID=42192 RepID=A0A6J8AVS4_MYTCO|nr:unnamed protein product [Mytilus coruscus]